MPNLIRIANAASGISQLSNPIVAFTRDIKAHVQVSMHQHLWGQFVYASHGVLLVTASNHRYIVPAQQGVWVPSHTLHEVTSQTDAKIVSVYIDNREAASLPNSATVLSVSPLLQALLVEAAQLPEHIQWYSADGRLLRLIRDYLCKANPIVFHLPYPTDKRLIKAVSIIERDSMESLNIQAVCTEVGMSVRHFSRLFKVETGITFREWKLRQRIQSAIQLLNLGHAVNTTALMLGYESASTFIAMFKQQTGVTPGEFLKV
ncbi:AraC family transcriptional regulator [Thalassotalea fusca]